MCAVKPVSHPTPITAADTTTRSTLGRPGDRRGCVDVSTPLRMVVIRMLHALVGAGNRTFLHAGRGLREKPARRRDGVQRGPNPCDEGGLPPRAERPLGRVHDADRGVCGGLLVALGFGCALTGLRSDRGGPCPIRTRSAASRPAGALPAILGLRGRLRYADARSFADECRSNRRWRNPNLARRIEIVPCVTLAPAAYSLFAVRTGGFGVLARRRFPSRRRIIDARGPAEGGSDVGVLVLCPEP